MQEIRRSLGEMFGRRTEAAPDLKSRARQEVEAMLVQLRLEQAQQSPEGDDYVPDALTVAQVNLDYLNNALGGMNALNSFLHEKNKAVSLSSRAERHAGADVLYTSSSGIVEQVSQVVGNICLSWIETFQIPVTHELLERGATYGRGSVGVLAHDRTELFNRVLKQIK